MIQPHHRPQESLRDSSNDCEARSRQRTPGPVAQLFQSKDSLDAFAHRWELPGWKMVDIFIFAHLRLAVSVTLYATFYVGSIFECRAKHFLLLLTMWAPPGSVHFDVAIF